MPFRLDEATVTVEGAAATGAESVELAVRNHLVEGPPQGGDVAYLRGDHRTVTLELRKLDDADTVNAAVRAGSALSAQVVLAHPAGHTLTIDLPVLRPESHRETAEPDALARGILRAEAETDPQGDDVTYSLSLAP